MGRLPETLRSWLGAESEDPRQRWRPWVLGVLIILVPVCVVGALLIGEMDITAGQVLAILLAKVGISIGIDYTVVQETVVANIRLPRAVLGLLVGAGLAMAGAAMQGVFRNPLADPGIIGVSGGGALGALLMIVLGMRILPETVLAPLQLYAVPVAAMLGAVLMTILIYKLSSSRGQVDLVSMLLVGIAINALAGAIIGMLTFVASDDELRTMAFWSLGSLGRATWDLIAPCLLFLLPPLLLLPRYARALNALLLGEEDAGFLGIPVQRAKRILVALSASLVGATVALCGIIGFIALVAPHIVRTAIGPDHRFLLPASAMLGAVLLLVADMGARTLAAPAELPIGILTSILGAPVFLALLLQRRRRAASV